MRVKATYDLVRVLRASDNGHLLGFISGFPLLKEEEAMEHLGCTLGIDIRTSSVKAIACDGERQEIAQEAVKVESWHNAAGAADQDTMVVYRSVMNMLTKADQEGQRLGYTVARGSECCYAQPDTRGCGWNQPAGEITTMDDPNALHG